MSASTAFALDLLRAASTYKENFVISPFSLGAALAIVHDGAKDDTQAELTRLIGKELSADEVCSLYSSLTSALSANDSTVTTSVANRFFLDTHFDLKPEYQTHIDKAYGVGAEKMDFNNGNGCAKHVNGFVCKNTGGMIPELVTSAMFANAVAVLINAVYFKGAWATPFDKRSTHTKVFHGVRGDRKVDFMSARKLNTRYSIGNDLTVVSLAYKDPAYSLVVLMPNVDFCEWLAALTAEKILEKMEDGRSGKIDLELPKFKIESTTNGKTVLQKCGVQRIFELSADLSGIANGIFVSEIVHKAVIEVSEEGTRAAAATAGSMERSRPPPIPSIRFDKSFMYVLAHKDAKNGRTTPLFIGVKVE